VRVAIVGGTGGFGSALARRLVEAGDTVVIGSRDAGRAADAARPLGAEGATNGDAVRGADLVVLATKAEAALETAAALRAAIGATPVLSVASELTFTSAGVLPGGGPTSIAERLAATLDAPVAAGLHSLAAATLGGDERPEEDALVCGDDGAAKDLALDLAGKVCDGRALDAGPLASARALEGMTAVIVNLNKRYKAHTGLRVTGLRR
jgi:8-hydroxy-5-deazaflavin:NADPH oxidoreductase